MGERERERNQHINILLVDTWIPYSGHHKILERRAREPLKKRDSLLTFPSFGPLVSTILSPSAVSRESEAQYKVKPRLDNACGGDLMGANSVRRASFR